VMCAACTNNDCKECIPPAKKCADPRTSQVCDSNGHWGATTSCALGCTDGDCWTCTPGDAPRCSPTSPETPQTCTMAGQWQDGMACVAPAHCVNGACLACTLGQLRCNAGHTALEVCDGNGQWQPTPCPSNVCVDPGECTPVPDAGPRF
jgi:hypothetical protein